MVLASWPLLRSHSAQIARIHRKPHLRLLSSTSHSIHGATCSLRLAHSGAETSHVVDTPTNRDFPINIMEKQHSIRTFSTFIEEGRQDEAAQTLADILASNPADGDLDAFRQLKDIIAPADSENPIVTFAMELGVSSASKGYTNFARTEILPILSQFGTPEMLSQLEHELTNAEQLKRGTLSEKAVFENVSDDYTAIQAHATIPQPSILELVEQKLPALLPEPVTGNTSIFEDDTAEHLYPISTDTLAHSDHLPTGVLDRLLADGNYDQAYHFLKEMKDLGANIPTAPKYGDIAWAILNDNKNLSAALPDQFLAWLSLVPPSDQLLHRDLKKIAGLLSDAEIPNTALLMRTSILFASKGFILQSGPMLNVICRNTQHNLLRNFVSAFEAAYKAYWQRTTPENMQYWTATIAYIRNNVVRTLAAGGRHRELKTFLPSDGSYKLWPSTYAFLLLYPKSEQSKERMRSIVANLDGQDEQALLQVKQLTLAEPIDFGDDLVSGIRYLKKTLASRTEIPHPLTIVHFMNTYLSAGRSTGLHIIFDRALRYNRAMARTFILAEMLFYRRLRHYDLVLETFVDHFYLVGVSRKDVLNRYNQIVARQVNYDRHTGQGRPLSRFYKFDVKKFLGKKLSPMTLHCNVVWDALVATSPGHDVERLYASFLRLAHERDLAERRVEDAANNNSDAKAPATPTPFKVPKVQPSSFTPFLRPMMAVKGPEAGSKMLQDILDLRLLPHRYIYTELAGFYARRGNVDKAFGIINQLEHREKFNHRPLKGPIMRIRSPAPDFAFYVAVLRGLLISRNVDAAEEVVRKIERSYKPGKGENHQYDTALSDLRDLKRLGSAWSRVSHTRRM